MKILNTLIALLAADTHRSTNFIGTDKKEALKN